MRTRHSFGFLQVVTVGLLGGLVGFGAGKASLAVECRFVDKATEQRVALGTFEVVVSGGLFGGSGDSEGLAKHAARLVGNFMEKGQ